MPFLQRRSQGYTNRAGALARGAPQPRAMTASASVVQQGDRNEAKRLQAKHQAWQDEAWTYRRSLGELRYATAYLGNSIMRLRLHPATFAPGEPEPIEVTDANAAELGVPLDLLDAARDSIARLGSGGPLAVQQIQKDLTENFEVAGECYLVGQNDPLSGVESWSIKSINELIVGRDGRYGIREDPSIGATSRDMQWLDPESSVVIRLWWPDPEFSALADSPVKAVRDICEELLLLGRDVRAAAKSRLANNGILMVPDTLSVVSASQGDLRDPRMDPFLNELIQTATTALANEGSAAAVVPILMRGPAADFQAVKHLFLTRPLAASNMAQRQELITRLATGIDLPAEVLTGKADLSHWTAWQVDDDTFRHHIEPIAIVEDDALTSGHLWVDLDERNAIQPLWQPADVRKIFIWHDPTALVSHPDKSKDAADAFDRGAMGRHALRRYLGLSETDKPDELDEVLYILGHARGVDPDVLNSILKTVTRTIHIPDPKSEQQPTDQQPGPPAAPGTPPAPPSTPPPENAPTGAPPPQPGGAPEPAGPQGASLVAAGRRAPVKATESRKLVDIDRQLRSRLQTAANATLKRALEKAGARVVSKTRTASAAPIREKIRNVPLARVPATCGPTLLASLGLHEASILDLEYSDLQRKWDTWVQTAQDQAVRTAAKIVGKKPAEIVTPHVQRRLDDDRAAGWNTLQATISSQASALLTDDGLDDEALDVGDLVSTGSIRMALAVAGGFASAAWSSGIGDDGEQVDSNDVMGQIGSGDTITGLLLDNGAEVVEYQWSHGFSDRPFEAHLDLDGESFTDWTDDVLAAPDGWPMPYMRPGDHPGCSCDTVQMWGTGESDDSSAE